MQDRRLANSARFTKYKVRIIHVTQNTIRNW